MVKRRLEIMFKQQTDKTVALTERCLSTLRDYTDNLTALLLIHTDNGINYL